MKNGKNIEINDSWRQRSEPHRPTKEPIAEQQTGASEDGRPLVIVEGQSQTDYAPIHQENRGDL